MSHMLLNVNEDVAAGSHAKARQLRFLPHAHPRVCQHRVFACLYACAVSNSREGERERELSRACESKRKREERERERERESERESERDKEREKERDRERERERERAREREREYLPVLFACTLIAPSQRPAVEGGLGLLPNLPDRSSLTNDPPPPISILSLPAPPCHSNSSPSCSAALGQRPGDDCVLGLL